MIFNTQSRERGETDRQTEIEKDRQALRERETAAHTQTDKERPKQT